MGIKIQIVPKGKAIVPIKIRNIFSYSILSSSNLIMPYNDSTGNIKFKYTLGWT